MPKGGECQAQFCDPRGMTEQQSPGLSDLPRRTAPSHGPEAEALLDEVRESVATLTGLLVYREDLGDEAGDFIRRAVEEVEGRLDRREIRVAIVGEPGSGKSTLLDALLGERLLGLTPTEPSIVITVRRAEQRAYRARLKSGAFEEFATRVPDPTRKLAAELAAAEEVSGRGKRRFEETRIELAAAADAVEEAESKLGAAFREFELARDRAANLTGDLDGAERAKEALVESAATAKSTLPLVLRSRPAWWALWSWIARLVVIVIVARAYRAYRKVARKLNDAEGDVAARRLETSRAADRCREAEVQLAAANGPVEQARKALADMQHIHDGAERRREELEREAERRRDDVDRAREERRQRFASEVRSLTDPGARGKEVDEIEIEFPARLLPDDVAIIDAAGATSENIALRDRAWRIIREQADGCIVVSELEHAVSSKAQKFLEQLKEAVPHAILVLTKMDESFSWAKKQGMGDPLEEVERARKIGTRRFAREVGRDPSAVLSVAVAAEEALREGEASEPARRSFEAAVALVFKLLRQERALILGARSAGIVRRCIGGATEARARAERSYQARLAALEAQRIPSPDLFRAEQMQAAEALVLDAARAVIAASKKTLAEQARLVRVECAQLIAARKTKDELRAVSPSLTEAISRGFSLAREIARAEMNTQAEVSLRQLESGVIVALRKRYNLLHEVDSRSGVPLNVDISLDGALPVAEFAPLVDGVVRSHDRLRVGFGTGGALAGAAAGTLALPGIGTAAGAIAGALLTFARTLGTLKHATVRVADDAIAKLESALGDQIGAAEPQAAAAIRAALGKTLEQALSRFGRWIAEPLEAEGKAIERARDSLRNLETLREQLEKHDARLASLIEAASVASVGLYA